ncbi:hypothetical protein BDF21DRAFT_413313, partial [Thamnidium elegans]
ISKSQLNNHLRNTMLITVKKNRRLNLRPGSDLMSQMIFNDPTAVDLIVQPLLGTDIPANSYAVTSNE